MSALFCTPILPLGQERAHRFDIVRPSKRWEILSLFLLNPGSRQRYPH